MSVEDPINVSIAETRMLLAVEMLTRSLPPPPMMLCAPAVPVTENSVELAEKEI
ncbi:hypothetical protein ACFOGJ_08465 [Marinibaculum pumilum]|uniref:Uncharacterized protein n=1 Tax=Marinibaculum pumilum TaxID=1766165 RepID=A0ABV7KXX1_9PROT